MKKNKILVALGGFFTGLINGFFGSGGGLVCVPLLRGAGKLPTKKAHATTVFLIAPICLVSVIFYAFLKKLNFMDTLPYIIGGVLGAPLGALLLKKLSNKFIRLIFAVFLIYAGINLLLRR